MPIRYSVKMQHSEESFVALAHMQYDLFSARNLFVRSLLGAGLILLGVLYMGNWWAYLLIAYGAFLMTGKYNSANRTARKLTENLRSSKLPFPVSRLDFTESDGLLVTSLPERTGEEPQRLPYASVYRLGEDLYYYYLFRDEYGGYMVPKSALGDASWDFKHFVEAKTGQSFHRKTTPFNRLRDTLRRRSNEPEHL